MAWVQRRASDLKAGDVVRDFGPLMHVKMHPPRHLALVWTSNESGHCWPESAIVEVDIPDPPREMQPIWTYFRYVNRA